MRVYLSGLYSGPNPSPGLGSARALRLAIPEAQLIGVDYSPVSTGLHDPVLDDVWIQRPWPELDLEHYAKRIAERLDFEQAWWLSGLDLEVAWLAKALPGHRRVLSPSTAALSKIAKPAAALAPRLGLGLPPTLEWDDDLEAAEFAADHGWRLWLKGPHYDAVRVSSWPALLEVRARLSEIWATEALHLQAHIAGTEESLAFVAHTGRLLEVHHMVKRLVTPEGKTWAGVVQAPSGDVAEIAVQLESWLAEVGWTGGGEVEMLRDGAGALWLIEVNPRLPAWHFGVTFAGGNLPASLLNHASGRCQIPGVKRAAQFVRVVSEIPIRERLPLPPLGVKGDTSRADKHPSGMPHLAERLAGERHPAFGPIPVGGSLADDLDEAARKATATPVRLPLPGVAVERFRAVADASKSCSTETLNIEPALSIKTQPEHWLLSHALALGFRAEVITADEARLALECGFPADRLVLNGPAKLWPGGVTVAGAAFADSVDELRFLGRAVRDGAMSLDVLGPRVRPVGSGSRFGCSVERPSELLTLVRAVDALPSNTALGLHLHLAASTVGTAGWRRALSGVLEIAVGLDVSSRPVEVIDLGGGCTPGQLDRMLGEFDGVISQLTDALPSLRVVLLEPGKAILQPAAAVFTRVLEVRDGFSGRDVVVDASIAELPQALLGPHPVMWHNRHWWQARRGSDRVLGRLCMEADVLADGVGLPDALAVGESLVLGLAGAYDMSMSYEFGRG